jgi:hypothetical protein
MDRKPVLEMQTVLAEEASKQGPGLTNRKGELCGVAMLIPRSYLLL